MSGAVVAGCEAASAVSAGPTPVKCQVALGGPSTLGPGGAGARVDVTAPPECAWSATSTAAWISDLSPSSGQGSGRIEFRVAANERPAARDGEIVVNEARVRISQDAAPCRVDLNPREQTISNDGGSGTVRIDVLEGCEWTARAEADWLRISGAASGSGDGRITFAADRNRGGRRTGAIVVGDTRAVIVQGGASGAPSPPAPDCTYSIAPASDTVAAVGGAGSVSVTAGPACAWSAESRASWISVTSGSSGAGSGQVGYLVLPNAGEARTGTVAIAGRTFTVTQTALVASPPAPACTYSITPTSGEFGSAGGSGAIAVSTGSACSWSADSNTGWISVTSGGSGTGNGTVGYAVERFGGRQRSGSLTVAGDTFTVSQRRDEDDDDDGDDD